MPVDTHEDIQPAAAIEAPNAVETHEDIQPAMGVMAADDREGRAYGGAIPGPKLDQDEPEQFGRRLIEWAFAAAPIVSRSNTPSFAGQWKYPNIHMRKDGGRVEYPLAMTEDAKKAKKGAKIKGMKPEKFLDEARPLNIGKGDRQVIDNFKRDIVSGDPLGPLKLYKDGTEDGRHRATAAEELDVSSVPVIDHRPGKYCGGGMGGGSMGGMGGFKGFSPGFKGYQSKFASSPVPQPPNNINLQQQQQTAQTQQAGAPIAPGKGGTGINPELSKLNPAGPGGFKGVGGYPSQSFPPMQIGGGQAPSSPAEAKAALEKQIASQGANQTPTSAPPSYSQMNSSLNSAAANYSNMLSPSGSYKSNMTSSGMLLPPTLSGVQSSSSNTPNYVKSMVGGYPSTYAQQQAPQNQSFGYPSGGLYDVWGPMFGMALGSYFSGLGGFGGFGGGYADGGAVDDDDQRELTPQGFYSAAAEAANNIPQKAPIDQILNKLKGSPNVKNEELDWSGVRDAFAGQKSVDPKEVAQHLQANLPQIQETVYGYDSKTKMKTALKPRYEDYATPGGNNYREVLLHLPEQGEGDYQSSHWGQYGANRPAVKNILAHLRLTDRGSHSFGYPEALHIEEVQSDWGQEGRDIGFDKRKGLNAEERRELNQLVSVPMRERTNDQMNRFNELINQRDFESVPSAPHVTSTEGWTDLALKRALVEAAKRKYKKLTWTPGEEQAERYGLDKSFSQIHYSPDTKHLFAKGKGDVDDIDMNVHEGALSGFIGKELAEKLIASPAVNNTQPSVKGETVKSLIGGQLAVPQKGMRDFYDRIIPNRLQKLVSKLDPDAKVQFYGHKIDVPGENYPSDANDWKGDEDDWEFKKVHSLEITPKLRAAILKGLPAYDHGGSVIKGALGVVSKYSR